MLSIRLTGPVLALTEDPALLTAQFERAAGLSPADLVRATLLDDVSTDEIIPAWCCSWFDDRLGDYAYLGLRHAAPAEGAVRALAPQVVVSGQRKGCGSSREHAVYAEHYAGVRLVFARSFARAYRQTCRNAGILTSDDFDLLDALLAGEEVGLDAFTRHAGGIERRIIALGGLLRYHRAGTPEAPAFAEARPLNAVEKIIQSRLAPGNRRPDGATVKLGESYFVEPDVRYSHGYMTPMAAEMFARQFGADTPVADPESCWFFQDDLSVTPTVLTRRRSGDEVIVTVENVNARHLDFAARIGGHVVDPSRTVGHTYTVGQIVVGTDSHTGASGAVGALGLRVGATEIAAAWYSRQVLVTVPEVVAVNLTGRLRDGVCARDLTLRLLTHPAVTGRAAIGRVLFVTGPGRADLDMDERTTLCTMAVDAGATAAVVEPDAVTGEFLRRRGDTPHRWERADDGATYAAVVDIDLATIEPMVSLPGEPGNAVPLRSIAGTVAVDRAYGGSCTGGTAHDMDMYASVFAVAKAHGHKVRVPTYVQIGSESVLAYAIELGYVQLFEDVGVTVLAPSYGAGVDAERRDGVTVSAHDRGFPGRSGPGRVYVASPYVVAASAIAGRLTAVEDLPATW